jgi:hypothetical protein
LQSKLPDISKNVAINGPGSSQLTIQGNGNAGNPYRIFTIKARITATINNLTIENGYITTGDGGGIYNSGTLYLVSDVIAFNTDTDANGDGGGVFNDGLGKMYITSGTQVYGNSAAYGGGVANQNQLTICCGSLILNNEADLGGGLFNTTSAVAAIQNNSVISGNQASIYGGGLYMIGGAVSISGGTMAYNTAYLLSPALVKTPLCRQRYARFLEEGEQCFGLELEVDQSHDYLVP